MTKTQGKQKDSVGWVCYEHWIRFLPEAGTIKDFATKIEEAESELHDLSAKIVRLSASLKKMEKEAYTRAYKGGWSEADIIEAKDAQIASWGKKS